MISGAGKTMHIKRATHNLQTMPEDVGGQKETLLKRAVGTKACTILVGNGKRDSLQFILRRIKESD